MSDHEITKPLEDDGPVIPVNICRGMATLNKQRAALEETEEGKTFYMRLSQQWEDRAKKEEARVG